MNKLYIKFLLKKRKIYSKLFQKVEDFLYTMCELSPDQKTFITFYVFSINFDQFINFYFNVKLK